MQPPYDIKTDQSAQTLTRLRMFVSGRVQGVGFRPFIYRLAHKLHLRGSVCNTASGVTIDVQGTSAQVDRFTSQFSAECPPQAAISGLRTEVLPPASLSEFAIINSVDERASAPTLTPELAICDDCAREINDPTNRRYRYPFTNCTNCGPRYTIVTRLPYDRPHTSMQAFQMCPDCRREYGDPSNRRFHAQPNACPTCGPEIELVDASGRTLAGHDRALLLAADAIRDGKIVALKGLGGYQLLADACNEDAVRQLRLRKKRPEKPLAVMYPSLALVQAHCQVTLHEERCLRSAAAPIVLLRVLKRPGNTKVLPVPAVSAGLCSLGVMLPYTPLHLLLMQDLTYPIVATSGNKNGDPICIDDDDARASLADIAHLFLIHNRPILRPADDSVVRLIGDKTVVLRLGRGLAPATLPVVEESGPWLAVGGHMKNAIALVDQGQLTLSQHIGDLDSPRTCNQFARIIEDLSGLIGADPDPVICDRHPNYYSTRYASRESDDAVQVPHHIAHVLTTAAEHKLTSRFTGFSWDGTGLGDDGLIWGGETFEVNGSGYRRVAHLRPFALPGGELAIRDPRRAAVGLLHALYGNEFADHMPAHLQSAFSDTETLMLARMLTQAVNSPMTTSVGRLFDAVAALLNVFDRVSTFEGQAAMHLEDVAMQSTDSELLPFEVTSDTPMVIDWGPTVARLLEMYLSGVPVESLARRFHQTLAEIVSVVTTRLGNDTVALGGGCFQNGLLLALVEQRLMADDVSVVWPTKVPINDGGLAVGQAWYATHDFRKET